jgi:hypothetical protein
METLDIPILTDEEIANVIPPYAGNGLSGRPLDNNRTNAVPPEFYSVIKCPLSKYMLKGHFSFQCTIVPEW